jgi:hypothetical protein
MGLMTPQEQLKHLKNEDNCTHTAVYTYLEKLNTFSRGHARQNPASQELKKVLIKNYCIKKCLPDLNPI